MQRTISFKGLKPLSLMGFLLVLVFSLGIGVASADESRVDRVSNASFSQTVKKLEKTIESEGMMIVGKVDHQNMLAMVGAKVNGAITVEFGKPDMMKMLFPMNPAVGLEMPLKVYVYESPTEGVVVSYRKVSPQYALYGDPKLSEAGSMMDMTLDKITQTATS